MASGSIFSRVYSVGYKGPNRLVLLCEENLPVELSIIPPQLTPSGVVTAAALVAAVPAPESDSILKGYRSLAEDSR